MGREIRVVRENWEHPRKRNGKYQPQFERSIYDYMQENRLSESEIDEYVYIYYRNFNIKDDEVVHYQLYENVSEGTPLSPHFETKSELKEWLLNNLDYWGYKWNEASIDNILETG